MSRRERTSVLRALALTLVIGMTGIGSLGAPVASADPPQPPPVTVTEPAPGDQESPARTAGEVLPDNIDLDKIPGHDIPSAPRATSAAASAAGVPVGPAPLAPGQVVRHEFDVVVAHLFDSEDQIPATPPAQFPHSAIDTSLAAAAKWWSNNTGLTFDFNTNTRYATINTTCDTRERDALAAMGQPSYDAYVDSRRDLLIYQADSRCGDYGGASQMVSPTGDVFAGGVIEAVISGWDGSYPFDQIDFVIAHEFGHTIGLGHSNVLDCQEVNRAGDDRIGPLWDGNVQTSCSSIAYWDGTTIMGMKQPNFQDPGVQTLNSLQRHYLGVAWDDALVDQPTTAQVFTVSRYDLAPAGQPRGVVVTDPWSSFVGSLEYRTTDNPDFLSQAGVYVTIGTIGLGLQTDIVEPIGPERGLGMTMAVRVPLAPGETYVSPNGSVRLRTISVDATTAQVEVTVTSHPGIPGEVSVRRAGAVLSAEVAAWQQTNISYQWFRNGQPVAGATAAAYTPPLPDPNAVYRVEATLTAPGFSATTRYSRGIVPDDQRLVVNGNTVEVVLADENGGPVECAGMSLAVHVFSPDGQDLGEQLVVAASTAQTGICVVPVNLPLTGNFRVEVNNPRDMLAHIGRESMYWQLSEGSLAISATSAGAGLLVAALPLSVPTDRASTNMYDGSTPVLMAGNGNKPLAVTVSVTGPSGAPAAGVTVNLSTNLPGLVFTDADPVTDQYGLARAFVDWDRSLPSLHGSVSTDIDAVVPGVGVVAGAPAAIQVWNWYGSRIAGWFESEPVAAANGTDAMVLHLRAWEESGQPIVDAAERVRATISMTTTVTGGFDVSISAPVWNPADQTYIVKITSTRSGMVILFVVLDDSNDTSQIMVPIEFRPGPPVNLKGGTVYMSASDGGCQGRDVAEGRLQAEVVDAYENDIGDVDGGVVFSLPPVSPLRFLSNPVVTRSTAFGPGVFRYVVKLGSAVSGRFEVYVSRAGSSVGETLLVNVSDGLIDPAASSVTIDAGPRLADGTDSHTVTADLVSMCHLPVTSLGTEQATIPNGYWLSLDATPLAGAQIGEWQADPAHPGRYSATVRSDVPGTYALTANIKRQDYQYPDYAPRETVVPLNAEPLVAEFAAATRNKVSLSLSEDLMGVVFDECKPAPYVSPEFVTGTVTVTDADGNPVVGAPVEWSAAAPLLVGSGSGVTDKDGTATVEVRLDLPAWWPKYPGSEESVTAVVGGVEASATVRVWAVGVEPPPAQWTLSAEPTGASPVPADGVASWTVTAKLISECGLPVAGQEVLFGANHSAVLSAPSVVTDENGVAFVRVTNTQPGIAEVSGAVGGVQLDGSPVSVTFVPAPDGPVVGVPVLGVANRTVISGTVVVGAGESAPVSVQVTYPSTRGRLMIETAVRDGKWSVATPDDAVSGVLTLVARDAHDNASAPVSGELVIPVLKAEVGTAGVHRSETQTVKGFGFAAGEKVRLVVSSDPLDVGESTADATGAVTFTFKIPADFPVGDHKATLTGETSGKAEASFQVLADNNNQTVPAKPGNVPQAKTGATVVPATSNDVLSFVELALVLSGLVTAAAAGQRRRAASRRH